jgi:hypothetical protein
LISCIIYIYIYIYYCEISYLIELKFYRIRLASNRLDKTRRTSIRESNWKLWSVQFDRTSIRGSGLNFCPKPNPTVRLDTYEKADLLKEEERKLYVTYRAILMQIFEDSDEKQYDRISIRKFVLNSLRETVVSKSMMKKKISSSKESQLFTSDDTSSSESTSTSNFVAVEISRFLSRKETSDKEMINLFRKDQSLNKENNISFRKKSFLCSNSSKLSNELFETENVSLNVLTSKDINFRINVVNIVQEKRIRKFSKDFANTTWISEKMKKILVFHTALMIVFNTKATELEIKTTSSFKFHISNLSKSSLHWRIMLRHSHAEKFIKAA